MKQTRVESILEQASPQRQTALKLLYNSLYANMLSYKEKPTAESAQLALNGARVKQHDDGDRK